MKALFYDTETTGLPLFSEPSEDPRQPHIVQLGAALVDLDTFAEIASVDVIVRPDGWTVPDDVAGIHGITTERAHAEGIPEREMLDRFIDMWRNCNMRVGHNVSFDDRMFRISLKRAHGPDSVLSDEFKAGPKLCTMWETTPLCKIPGRFAGKFKWPNLSEAYAHFFGREFDGAHSARGDVDATIAVYFAIMDAKASA